MTLDGFRDVTETPISLDFSNSWIADIRLNAGDKDGRTITVAITDNGQPITSTTGITSVALAYNTAPGVEVGDRVPMTPVSGQETATYRATLPRRAIAKPGVIALGVEVTTADGAKICSRNFKGVVERAVWDAESTQGQDSLTRLEQLIADGDAAITRVNNAITDANNAVAAANQVIADARITGGNTTTLDPNQPATSSLRGSGLQRVLDLSIPRGAGVTSAGATTLPQQARHRQHAAGRKQGRLHAPGRRAPRQQDHRRGREHRQPLPAGGRQHVHRRRGRQEPHPRHPARRADRRRDRPHPRRRHGRHRHRHPGRGRRHHARVRPAPGSKGRPRRPGHARDRDHARRRQTRRQPHRARRRHPRRLRRPVRAARRERHDPRRRQGQQQRLHELRARSPSSPATGNTSPCRSSSGTTPCPTASSSTAPKTRPSA